MWICTAAEPTSLPAWKSAEHVLLLYATKLYRNARGNFSASPEGPFLKIVGSFNFSEFIEILEHFLAGSEKDFINDPIAVSGRSPQLWS